VRANAAERRGTHATKTRALVSGSGKKPWRQKGTGRARVARSATPLWRKGGTVFGPQPRSYEYQLPRKVEKGALRAALSAEAPRGRFVDCRDALAGRSGQDQGGGRALLKTLGATGNGVARRRQAPDEQMALSVRNVPGVADAAEQPHDCPRRHDPGTWSQRRRRSSGCRR
jgi:large subunit ribosomal protein L4